MSVNVYEVGTKITDGHGDVWVLREDGWCCADIVPVESGTCNGWHVLHGWSLKQVKDSYGIEGDDPQPVGQISDSRVIKPGHVQIRVDDMDEVILRGWGADRGGDPFDFYNILAYRAGKAFVEANPEPEREIEEPGLGEVVTVDGAGTYVHVARRDAYPDFHWCDIYEGEGAHCTWEMLRAKGELFSGYSSEEGDRL